MFAFFEEIFMVFLYGFIFATIASGVIGLFDFARAADRRLKIDFKQ